MTDEWHSSVVGHVTPDGEVVMYDEPVVDPEPIKPASPQEFIGRIDRGRVDENGPMLPAPGTQVKRLADVRLFEVYCNPPDYWPGHSQP